MKHARKALALLVSAILFLSSLSSGTAVLAAPVSGEAEGTVIDVTEYGADPSGASDSAPAIQKAIDAAAQVEGKKTLYFPKGTYNIYPDKAVHREQYISNTVGTNGSWNTKIIGILLKDLDDITLEGSGSLFQFHGRMTTLMTENCHNVTLRNFDIDWQTPPTVDVTVIETNGNEATLYIPESQPYEVKNNHIFWTSELSPYTGQPYWSGQDFINGYAQIADAKEGSTWRGGNELFSNIAAISDLGSNLVKITYSNRDASVKPGLVVQMRPPVRDQTGLLLWKSTNVLMEKVNIRFFHGFALEGMHSKDLTFRDMDFRTDKSTGRISSGTADHIHMSTCGGQITVENCRFNDPHDDPINIHGTYNQVVEILAPNKIKVRFKHHETAGFPNFFEGDQLGFTRQDDMIAINETFTVTHVDGPDGLGGNMGEGSGSLTDMILTLDHDIPSAVAVNEYAVENLSYVPDVLIRNNLFIESPTRGVLCTTSGKVVIENNRFESMNQAGLYLSNDAQSWYESGPIKDMVIRNNTFIHNKSYPILIEPTNPTVDAAKPVHHNITIEDNTFYTQGQTVVSAKSTEGLTIRNNRVLRENPVSSFDLSVDATELVPGQSAQAAAQYNPYSASFTTWYLRGCSNVTIEGNTYDTGISRSIGLSATDAGSVSIVNDEAGINNSTYPSAAAAVSYISSDPSVVQADASGALLALKAGTASVQAIAKNGEHIYGSNPVEITVSAASSAPAPSSVELSADKTVIQAGESLPLSVTLDGPEDMDETIRFQAWNASLNKAEDLIDENGIFASDHEGVFVLSASAINGQSGRKVIVVQDETYGMAEGFTLESCSNPSTVRFDASGVEMDFVKGGLWESQVPANVLALETSGQNDSLEVTVHADGIASEHYSDVVLALMNDGDNYVALERKLRGTVQKGAVVREVNGSGKELWMQTGNEGTSPVLNDTSADFRIVKEGNTVTGYLSFSKGEPQWQEVASTDASFLNDSFKIALMALDSYGPTKTTTVRFSNLTINGTAVALSEKLPEPVLSSSEIIYDEASDTVRAADESALAFWMIEENGTTRMLSSIASGTLICTPEMKDASVKALLVPVIADTHAGTPVMSEAVRITGEGRSEAEENQPVSDAYLKTADFEGLAKNFAFNRNTTSYITLADQDEDSLSVHIEADDPKASLLFDFNDVRTTTCPETVKLHAGQNILKVRVTAQDGETVRDYRFVIFRTGDSNRALSSLTINGEENNPGDADTVSLKFDAPQTISVEAVPVSDKAEVSLYQNGRRITDGKITAAAGLSEAVIAVKPETSAFTRYITLKMQAPDPALADLAEASFSDNIAADKPFASDVISYQGEAFSSLTSVHFAAVETDALISLALNGTTLLAQTGQIDTRIELEEGENTVEVLVVSPDQSNAKVYTWTLYGEGYLYLSDLEWTDAQTGYAAAPVRRDLSSDGNPLRVFDGENVLTFAKGLSTHAPGYITFNLEGLQASRLEVWLGLDREVYNATYKPHVRLEVEGDGEVLYATQPKYHDSAAEKAVIDLEGISTLTLSGKIYENNYSAHCDFADAKIIVPFKGEQVSISTAADPSRGTAFADREDGLYQIGAYATLKAESLAGWNFAGWTDEEGQIVSTENPLRMEVSRSAVLTAQFTPDETPAEEADKTLLIMAAAKAEELQQAESFASVNELVKAHFTLCLQQANTLIADASASQAAVDEAWKQLSQAIHMLGFTTDKSGLSALIAAAEAINLEDYQASGIEEFQAALAYAREVQADPAALDGVSIQAAIEKLQNAMDHLEPVVQDLDLSILALLVAEGSSIDLDAYLDAGKDEFTAALTHGASVLEAAESQEQIDSAASALHTAWLNLRLRPDESILALLRSTAAKADALDYSLYSLPVQAAIRTGAARIKAGLNNPDLDQNQALELADTARTIEALMASPDADSAFVSGSNMSAAPQTSSKSSSVRTAVSMQPWLYAAGAASMACLLVWKKRRK